MTDNKHILICGDVGIGKSYLIRRLLSACGRPVSGFVTLRRKSKDGECFVYIQPAGCSEYVFTDENRVGRCGPESPACFPAVFDTVGVSLLQAESGSVILMDELGFMENGAELFRAAVFKTLDHAIPVIAAVKSRQTPFLDAVRAHKNAETFFITPQNRESLYDILLPRVLAWQG